MERLVRIFRYGSPEYDKALSLRYEVLRKPLRLEFTAAELQKDREDIHYGLFEGKRILGCLILTKCEQRKIKMRQVAVDNQFQGQGLGKELCQAAEKYARDKGFKLMFCNARKTAVPFYQKMEYRIVSDEFTEVNIPHYTMEKAL
jgi:N-acetylglutamate synthase-like GNAT family acetyltransferase